MAAVLDKVPPKNTTCNVQPCIFMNNVVSFLLSGFYGQTSVLFRNKILIHSAEGRGGRGGGGAKKKSAIFIILTARWAIIYSFLGPWPYLWRNAILVKTYKAHQQLQTQSNYAEWTESDWIGSKGRINPNPAESGRIKPNQAKLFYPGPPSKKKKKNKIIYNDLCLVRCNQRIVLPMVFIKCQDKRCQLLYCIYVCCVCQLITPLPYHLCRTW